jgi:hypothetical protein
MKEAAEEGASALRYRIERLRALTASDDLAAAELIDRWILAAQMLDALAGVAS